MIAGALVVRVQCHHASADGDLRLRAGVPFVGFPLTFGADALTHGDTNLIVFRSADVDGAASVVDVKAGSGRESLSEPVVIVIFRSENRKVIVIVNIDVVPEFSPIEAGSLGCYQPKNDDDQNQENPTRADSGRPR